MSYGSSEGFKDGIIDGLFDVISLVTKDGMRKRICTGLLRCIYYIEVWQLWNCTIENWKC